MRSHATHFALFSHKDLKVLVDNGHSQQNTSARPNGSHEVCEHGKGADAETSKGCSSWDVSVQLVDHGGLSVASHHHLLFLSCLATSFAELPETSIQVLLKKAQEPSMK